MCGAALSDESLSFAVVEVIVRENQIEATRCQRAPSRRKTRHNRDTMRSQELMDDLLRKYRVVLKVENVQGAFPLTMALTRGAPMTLSMKQKRDRRVECSAVVSRR